MLIADAYLVSWPVEAYIKVGKSDEIDAIYLGVGERDEEGRNKDKGRKMIDLLHRGHLFSLKIFGASPNGARPDYF
jgi:hypothetical protein